MNNNGYNGYDNQKLHDPTDDFSSVSNMGARTANRTAATMNNAAKNLATGVKNYKEKKKNSLDEDKKDGEENNNEKENQTKDEKKNDNQNKKENQNKENKNDKDNNSNPGTGQKKPKQENGINNKKTDNNKFGNKNGNQKSLMPNFNPFSRNKNSNSPSGKGTKKSGSALNNNKTKNNLLNMALKGSLKIKIIIIGSAIIVVLILALLLFLLLTNTVIVATAATMCGSSSSTSSYNGEDYSGSANVKEFMCKMQNPLADPSLYKNYDNFGEDRGDHIHAGIDLASYGYKSIPIYAAQAGVVTAAGYNGSMGYYAKIDHGGVMQTIYMHMKQGTLKVKKGDKVGKGQQIGNVGSTGNSTGPHLHFEIRTLSNNKPQNPGPYFKSSFKENCGSMWDGELAGDSANAANNTSSDYVSESATSTSSNCCGSGSSGSSEPVEGLPKILTQEFVDGAISTQTKYQVPASLTLAQIIQESSGSYPGNLSGLAYECKNLFGIKKGSSNGPTCTFKTGEETSSGGSYTVTAKFRKYSNYKESIEDHGKFFVDNSRYKDCFSKKTGDEWARCIKQAGYATDVDYAEKLIGHMKKYNLYKYDEYTSSNVCSLGKGSFDGKIWYFDQTDYKQPYGSYGTISSHGCGTTAMAIAVSSLLKAEHDPVELTNYACSNGYCTSDGTSHNFFAAAAKKYGLTVKRVSKSNSDEIFTALNGGQSIVIVIMGPGKFTSGGHFITLTGSDGDKVFVHDPNNGDGKGYNKLWDFKTIKNEAYGSSPFWIISK